MFAPKLYAVIPLELNPNDVITFKGYWETDLTNRHRKGSDTKTNFEALLANNANDIKKSTVGHKGENEVNEEVRNT
jgi:hypothetical protein